MAPLELPLNTAHQHAANAEEYESGGFLIPAAEEHQKAADAFAAAEERTEDESVKRTLEMLQNKHAKANKELQRKIDKLRAENKDPTLSQKAKLVTRQGSDNISHGTQATNVHDASTTTSHTAMSDSQIPGVDESFMVLGGQRSDPGDAFNQFWNIMQGMLDNLSQPVAFATVPLGTSREATAKSGLTRSGVPEGSLSSDTDLDEPLVKRMTRKIGITHDGRKNRSFVNTSKAASQALPGDSTEEEFDEFGADELSESFCLIPSSAEPSASKLRTENVSLKVEVDMLKQRLQGLERFLEARKEQDQHFRDSIVMAGREVQRAMVSSTIGVNPNAISRPSPPLDFNNLLNFSGNPILSGTAASVNPGREAQYLRRIKELEEEVRYVKTELKTTQAENEKHKVIIAKFKDRWDKLKESAKRKKEARAYAAAENAPVRERIEEEPELEQNLDEVALR